MKIKIAELIERESSIEEFTDDKKTSRFKHKRAKTIDQYIRDIGSAKLQTFKLNP